MNYGMLWFDNDPKTDLSHKINRAAVYYRRKYGDSPNMCLVNPEMVTKKSEKADGVEIKTSQTILPNHLWIGKNAEQKMKKGI